MQKILGQHLNLSSQVHFLTLTFYVGFMLQDQFLCYTKDDLISQCLLHCNVLCSSRIKGGGPFGIMANILDHIVVVKQV